MTLTGQSLINALFAFQCLGGFLLMVFGAALIESPDLATAIVGAMLACVGILAFIMFGVLLARKED